MEKFIVLVLACFIALRSAHSFPVTAPAFLWSPHHSESSGVKEIVSYRTISTKDLAKTVLSDGGWSSLMCPRDDNEQFVDFAVVFVGQKLHTADISGGSHVDQDLINMLKVSFTSSNSSVAFPYVAVPDESEAVENYLLSGIKEACGELSHVNNVVFTGSCSIDEEDLKKLSGLPAISDHITSRSKTEQKGQTDLVIVCSGESVSSKELDQPHREGEMLSDLISILKESNARYTFLYVSDPYRMLHYPPHSELERFLAEKSPGNKSASSTSCDSVCQFTSTLLEGVIVGIVLLLILISGLLCMMGIDTPTRFEVPQDS